MTRQSSRRRNERALALAVALGLACASSGKPPAAAPAATPAPPPAAKKAPAPPAAAPAAAPPKTARPVDAIVADVVRAIGDEAAWKAHKSIHAQLELSFQGMGISGKGERFSTNKDKSLTITELPGIGQVREGGNGTLFWAQDPVNGLRRLEAVEAEQARAEAAWNIEQRLKEFYPTVESKMDVGPGGAPLECLVLTPKVGSALTNCYDPTTHLQVLQKGTRATPQGDTPFVTTVKDWREVGGLKMPFAVDTQAGPITFTARMTDVKLDEALDDKMFEPPSPQKADAKPTAKAKPKGKAAAPKP